MPELPQTTKDSLSVKFARGAFWILIGNVVSRLASFLGTIIIARLLGQTGFGEFSVIQSTIYLFGTLTGLGIGMTVTRYVAELKELDPGRTGRIIALSFWVSWLAGGLMVVVCFFGASYLAGKVLNAPNLVDEFRLTSFLLLISTIFGRQQGILAGLKAFKEIAVVQVAQGILSLPLIAWLVWQAGLWGGIIALILSALLTGVLSTYYLMRACRRASIRTQFFSAWRERSVLWNFSLPNFLAGLLSTPPIWVINAIIVNQPRGYAELGLFNAANQFHRILMALISTMATVYIPIMAELSADSEQNSFNNAFNKHFQLTTNIGIAIGFLTLGLSPWLIKIFGRQFSEALNILPLTIAFTVPSITGSICSQALIGAGKMWYGLINAIFWGLMLIITGYFLIPLYLGTGMAVSFLITYVTSLILQVIMIYKLFGKSAITNNLLTFIYLSILILSAINYFNIRYYNLEIIFIIISFFLWAQIINKNIAFIKRIFSDIVGTLKVRET